MGINILSPSDDIFRPIYICLGHLSALKVELKHVWVWVTPTTHQSALYVTPVLQKLVILDIRAIFFHLSLSLKEVKIQSELSMT